MRHAVALGIDLYQRKLSPLKGYRCAHNHLHKHGSCSQFAKRVVLRWGVLRLFPLLRLRFIACRKALILLSAEAPRAEGDGDKMPKKTVDDDLINSCALNVVIGACCSMVPF
jgi:putative component of membrane protein insertase Oxa1/YidC/SpoIIIJ protein YidD